ncbi:hypothetical protein Cadr_000002738 [Camelus dromedarius]|uniref:Uncharacterized protein n=1 Tax=Camelus dromedarius TaxID=9838 RepID=A0A5N4C3Y5_CAMDR|nr:hypothetical protein Cadr_000002738 [Camelus dromedarius]
MKGEGLSVELASHSGPSQYCGPHLSSHKTGRRQPRRAQHTLYRMATLSLGAKPWCIPPPRLGREFHISFQDNKNICAKAEEEAGHSEASLPGLRKDREDLSDWGRGCEVGFNSSPPRAWRGYKGPEATSLYASRRGPRRLAWAPFLLGWPRRVTGPGLFGPHVYFRDSLPPPSRYTRVPAVLCALVAQVWGGTREAALGKVIPGGPAGQARVAGGAAAGLSPKHFRRALASRAAAEGPARWGRPSPDSCSGAVRLPARLPEAGLKGEAGRGGHGGEAGRRGGGSARREPLAGKGGGRGAAAAAGGASRENLEVGGRGPGSRGGGGAPRGRRDRGREGIGGARPGRGAGTWEDKSEGGAGDLETQRGDKRTGWVGGAAPGDASEGGICVYGVGGSLVWEGLERDVKGQHKKGARGAPPPLATKGRGGREGEAAGRKGHTQGGASWGWTVREEGGPGLRQAREGKGEQTRGKGADGRVCSAEGRDLTLPIQMTQRPRWGPHRRDGATKAGPKLPRGKRVAGAATDSAGRRHHRPLPVPSGSGLGRGGAEPGRYHSEQRGGLGRGKGGARGQNPVGGGGGATPWEKGLGTSRMDQSANKARVASRGSSGQWEGRTLRRLGVGVVYSTFQRLPSSLKDGVACITPGPRGAQGAEEGGSFVLRGVKEVKVS